jgi:hypothetical protein
MKSLHESNVRADPESTVDLTALHRLAALIPEIDRLDKTERQDCIVALNLCGGLNPEKQRVLAARLGAARSAVL